MRYDAVVCLFKDSDGKYNPLNHKHMYEPELVDTVFANVTDLGLKNQVEELGGIKQGSKTIRTVDKITKKWDYLTIDGDKCKYRFISSIDVLKGFAMIVGEDVG